MPISPVKILILAIIFGSFVAMIVLVAKQFATTCPSDQRYDEVQKKCIQQCTSSQIYDENYKGGACRKNCQFPSIWSSVSEDCITCIEGEVYDPVAGICVQGCINDSDCGSASGSGPNRIYKTKCVAGKCCDTPCLTKDGYKCCQNCNQDPLNAEQNICCSPSQICQDSNGNTTCCSGTSICINNQCLQPCGPGDERNIKCEQNQKCVVVGNVDSTSNLATQAKTNSNIIYDTNTKNLYTCVNTDTGCYKGNQYAVPPAINNHYPCFQIDKTDTATGLGFCSAKELGNTNGIDLCKTFKNKNECNGNNTCYWYDVLQEMKDEPSQMKLNNIMKQTFNQNNGYYCADDPNLSYGRAVGKQLFSQNVQNSTKSCDYLTCVNELANPSVSDIYYNDKTGACVGIQQCNRQDGLTNQVQSYDQYGNQILQENNNPDWTSNFPESCDTPEAVRQCSNFITETSNICIDGRIIDAKAYCNNNGTSDPFGNCICSIAKPGDTQYYGRRCNLTRAQCNNSGIPSDVSGNVVTCTCDANSGLTGANCNTVKDIPQSLPSDVPDLIRSGCGSLLLIPGPGVTFTSYNVVNGYDRTGFVNTFWSQTPSQTISDYSKNIGGIYVSEGNGVRVTVTINFKNNNSNTTLDFVQNICGTEAPTPWRDRINPVDINNYYFQSGRFFGNYCNVYYIGMNK